MKNHKPSYTRFLMASFAAIIIASCFIAAVCYKLYMVSKENLFSMWRNTASQTVHQINYYLTTPTDAVNFSALKIEELSSSGASSEEILDYLHNETDIYSRIISDNTTGIYCYYKGDYLDGSRWVPPDNYDPLSRPWYKEAAANNGELTLVKPYLNLQTYTMMMSVSRMLSDNISVVSMDVFLDGVQEMTEDEITDDRIVSAFVMDNEGFVVACSDADYIGADFSETEDEGIKELYENVIKGDATFVINDGIKYRIFSSVINDNWYYILVLDEADMLGSLRYIYFFSGAFILFAVIIILAVFWNLTKKHHETERLNREIKAVANIYMDMAKVDFNKDTLTSMRQSEKTYEKLQNKALPFSETFVRTSEELLSEKSNDILHKFVNPEKIKQELTNSNSISYEFLDIFDEWVRMRFFVVDRNDDNTPHNAILAYESIDKEKKQQEHLRTLSETDLMTGINNRISGETKIKQMLDDIESGMYVMLDADRFKYINDNFGHGVGDKVIIAIAKSMQKTFRDSDVIFRLGGDEFAAFAPNVNTREDAQNIIDRLFDNINKINVPELLEHRIYVSAGISFYLADTNDSFESLYERADKAAYESKKVKGNKATFSKDIIEPI